MAITIFQSPVVLAATTEYAMYPGTCHAVNLGAYASLEFYNGEAWKAYPSATGAATQDKDFVFTVPVSGRVRVVITAAQTGIVGFYPVL